MPSVAHADITPRRPARASRALQIFLAVAFVTTLAASVVSWVVVDVSRSLPGAGQDAASLARRIAWLQQANLALIALAVLLTAAAFVIYFRRTSSLSPWVKICAWTRRVEWQGRWITFEEFLAQRFDLRCTHGISEEAAAKLHHTKSRSPLSPPTPNGRH